MSTPLALQDILVSIADSLSQAQQQLNNMPQYDSLGRPCTTYQLPYLDFNIELSAKFDIDNTINNNTQDGSDDDPMSIIKNKALFNSQYRAKGLLFALPSLTQTTVPKTVEQRDRLRRLSNLPEGVSGEDDLLAVGEESNESKTIISGRFIAVLPNEGLPQTFINVSCVEDEKNEDITTFLIKVNLINTAGELLAYQRIEFNFDEETSFLLNRDISQNVKVTAPKFSSQEELTNQDGYAETKVTVNNFDLENNLTIVIRVNSGIISKSISL